MSMHLEGPWLSTTGRRKGKKKWASAEQKRQAEQLEREWQQLQAKYEPANKPNKPSNKPATEGNKSRKVSAASLRREVPHIPSLDTGVKGAVTVKKPMQYTGDKIVGIGTMHKSNAVPIFSDQEAKEISAMRR